MPKILGFSPLLLPDVLLAAGDDSYLEFQEFDLA